MAPVQIDRGTLESYRSGTLSGCKTAPRHHGPEGLECRSEGHLVLCPRPKGERVNLYTIIGVILLIIVVILLLRLV